MKHKKDIKNIQIALEKEQNNVKNELINNLFSIFNSFQNYYLGNELKENVTIVDEGVGLRDEVRYTPQLDITKKGTQTTQV